MVTEIVIERDNCSASFGESVTILTPDKKTLHDILERLGAFEPKPKQEDKKRV